MNGVSPPNENDCAKLFDGVQRGKYTQEKSVKEKYYSEPALSLVRSVTFLGCTVVCCVTGAQAFVGYSSCLKENSSQAQTRSGQQTIFQFEAPFTNPVPLPISVIKGLMRDRGIRHGLAWQTTEEFRRAFVAAKIDLNADGAPDIVIKPVDQSLFGANIIPFWVFRNTGRSYKLALTISALGLEILDVKTKGYRDIRASQANAKELFTTTFKYDGRAYVKHSTSRSPLG